MISSWATRKALSGVVLLLIVASRQCSSKSSSSSSCDLDPPKTDECQPTLAEKETTEQRKQQKDDLQHQQQCTIYMAPSTIPGAGLGIFTGIERSKREIIGHGDVMIPLTDVWFHLEALGEAYVDRPDTPYLDVPADFVWFGPELGMTREASYPVIDTTEYLVGFAPGIDAAINCHLALENVDKKTPEFSFEGLHRSQDPGAGAFTPYHGCKTYATHDIPAGGELFKTYGDHWFVARTHSFGLLPLTKNYKDAEFILGKLHRILETHNVPDETRKDVWNLLHNLTWEESRTMNAMPKDYDNLELVASNGIRAAYQPQATRSLEYLEERGRCMDNVIPRTSTIRQAGRGAFATRFLPKDKIITGSPMLFFPSRDYFNMFAGDWYGKLAIDKTDLVGLQLLVNYCWHHEESSIYLCPYGGGINYINHNKTQANVRLQWAEDGQMNHDGSLLKQSPTTMYYQSAPRLHMDVVATRDIAPGEELFLDYGTAWENAWWEHVQGWEKARHSSGYISPREWNKLNAHTMLRTEEEQVEEPYPNNFQLYCLPEIDDDSVVDMMDSLIAEQLWNPSTQGFPCRIKEREQQENGDYWYIVEFAVDEVVHDPQLVDQQEWVESDWIVREAMRFEDAPYSTDIFLRKAFRHPIGFPDDIFPGAWRGAHIPPLPADPENYDFEIK